MSYHSLYILNYPILILSIRPVVQTTTDVLVGAPSTVEDINMYDAVLEELPEEPMDPEVEKFLPMLKDYLRSACGFFHSLPKLILKPN